MLTPHTGEARIWLCGRELRLRLTWAALSRLEHEFGDDWATKLADVSEQLDALQLARFAQVISGEVIHITPDFAYGSDTSATLALLGALQGVLGSGYSGPGSSVPREPESGKKEPETGSAAALIPDALAQWVRLGLDPTEFWDLTPYQTNLALKAAAQRRTDAHGDAVSCAWLTGRLFHSDPKRFPKLSEVLPGRDGDRTIPKDATTEQAFAIFKSTLGGGDG